MTVIILHKSPRSLANVIGRMAYFSFKLNRDWAQLETVIFCSFLILALNMTFNIFYQFVKEDLPQTSIIDSTKSRLRNTFNTYLVIVPIRLIN